MIVGVVVVCVCVCVVVAQTPLSAVNMGWQLHTVIS